MELREALSQIAEIRARIAATEQFQGYRAVPVALTGLYAVLAGLAQPWLAPEPPQNLPKYLTLWVSMAAIATVTAGSGLWLSDQQRRDSIARKLTWLAIWQFVPCLLTGALVTLVIVRHVSDHAVLLPGLWQVFFSLGIFASFRLLPSAVVAVGVFYLISGLVNLMFADAWRFSPWMMGLPFGVGQWLTAGVLYWNLERSHHG